VELQNKPEPTPPITKDRMLLMAGNCLTEAMATNERMSDEQEAEEEGLERGPGQDIYYRVHVTALGQISWDQHQYWEWAHWEWVRI
jgi:hypothetical protein